MPIGVYIHKLITKEHKRKISESLKKTYQQNPELKKKIVESRKGYTHSEKTKSKISKKNFEKRVKIYGWPRKYLVPNFNSKACKVFGMFDKTFKTTGRFAGKKNEGEKKIGKYSVDYYNEELRIIIEWNEKAHYDINGNLNQKDIDKREYIEKRCPGFRYIILKED